jgi:GNAT superfamily N-acetyltransferase
MGYEIGISQVGPAEYPLLEVLRESIFGEYGHRSLTRFADILDGRKDVLTLIAHLEGNPVGFKVGCADGPGVYHSRSGGVLKDYRRQGLGSRMQQWQHQFAKSRGYKKIYFNTFNHFRGMMLFGLQSGFRPVAAEWRELDAMSFKFVKDLDAPPPALAAEAACEHATKREVDPRDLSRLHRLISDGFQMTGIHRGMPADQVGVMLERL